MAFEHHSHRAATQEAKKEFFGRDGHFTDYGIEQWLNSDVSYNSRRKSYKLGKEHLAVCRDCSEHIEHRRLTDPGGKSNAVPVHDRE